MNYELALLKIKTKDNEGLKSEISRLNETISNLNTKITELEESKSQALKKLSELEELVSKSVIFSF